MIRVRLHLFFAGIVACCLGFATEVSAQGAETIVKVQTHFEKGAEYFQKGDYEAAIAEFEAGNGLLPNPIFLYNISLAHGKLGRVEQSLAVARLAEATGLDEPDATQNRARISALMTAQQALTLANAMEPVPEPAPPLEEPLFSTLGWIGVASASLGVVSLVGATIMDASIGTTIENYEAAAASGDATNYRLFKSEIESDQVLTRSLFFIGLGLSAAGAGLVAYDLFWDESTLEMAVSPTSDGVSGAFRMTW